MSDELRENYAGAFDGHLAFGRKPALVVIDMVKAYFEPDSPLYAGVEDTRASCLRVLAAARAAGIPIVHTNVSYQPGGFNAGVFYRKVPALRCFEAGNPLASFATGFDPGDGELVITKQYASAFFGTSLSSTLTANRIDTLLIGGVSTSGCVRATATDAMQHGFIPIVVREAVGDRHARVHEANLFDIQAKCGEVKSEAEVLHFLETWKGNH